MKREENEHMKMVCFGSSSAGNSYYVELTRNGGKPPVKLLLEAGLPYKESSNQSNQFSRDRRRTNYARTHRSLQIGSRFQTQRSACLRQSIHYSRRSRNNPKSRHDKGHSTRYDGYTIRGRTRRRRTARLRYKHRSRNNPVC